MKDIDDTTELAMLPAAAARAAPEPAPPELPGAEPVASDLIDTVEPFDDEPAELAPAPAVAAPKAVTPKAAAPESFATDAPALLEAADGPETEAAPATETDAAAADVAAEADSAAEPDSVATVESEPEVAPIVEAELDTVVADVEADAIVNAELDAEALAAADEALAAAQAEPAPRSFDEGPELPPAPAVPPRIARFGGPLESPSSQPATQPGAYYTVLQPMTPLRDVELVKRPVMPEDERRLLHTWSAAMERALREDRPGDAVRLAHPVLRQLPRHLATYYRLIRAAWMLRRWDEGDGWGRRLLRADPSNALAWRAVAMAVEQRGERARACARWQRAFECDPYEPEVRAGLVRTSLDLARLPQLSEACLGSLLLRGYRWEHAVNHFRVLTGYDSRRLDFQANLLLALWQLERQREAYELARKLAQAQPYLLMAWVVIDEAGDDNDKALARHPLSTMDPDGDYVRAAWGISYPARSIRLTLTDAEKALIEGQMEPAQPA